MKRILLFGMILLFTLSISCSRHVIKVTYPEKFEGMTQLILASQTATVSFTEDVSKSLLAIFKSHAQVKVVSSVTYDFYVDFQVDGYNARIDKKAKTLYFEAPPIRVKKPIINNSTVSYPETGILVDEDKEAVKILETLTDRFISEGLVLLKQEKVHKMCEEKLIQYLMGLSKELKHNIEMVEVTFREMESTV